MTFDEFPEDIDGFHTNFAKRVRKILEEIDRAAKNGKFKGKWEINQIDRPGVKGYVIHGYSGSAQPSEPLDPFDPFEPWNPRRRRPMPKRRFEISENAFREDWKPLVDIFEEDERIKVYVEVIGEDKDDLQLNVAEDAVEVKGREFYKRINLPAKGIETEKASSRYNNGVLEVTIPRKKMAPSKKTRKIKIE